MPGAGGSPQEPKGCAWDQYTPTSTPERPSALTQAQAVEARNGRVGLNSGKAGTPEQEGAGLGRAQTRPSADDPRAQDPELAKAAQAKANYERFHGLPTGTATLDQVATSAGVPGWTASGIAGTRPTLAADGGGMSAAQPPLGRQVLKSAEERTTLERSMFGMGSGVAGAPGPPERRAPAPPGAPTVDFA